MPVQMAETNPFQRNAWVLATATGLSCSTLRARVNHLFTIQSWEYLEARLLGRIANENLAETLEGPKTVQGGQRLCAHGRWCPILTGCYPAETIDPLVSYDPDDSVSPSPTQGAGIDA